MFVQVIRGEVTDRARLWDAFDRWERDLRPGAEGFLGSTAGITEDGQFVAVARFESEDAARRNSDRREQGAWWSETENLFTGPVDFFDSKEVDVSMGGGTNDAGFVQVLFGHGDRERARSVLLEGEDVLRRERPDILGGVTAWGGDGRFVDVAYFRSEAEARAGEKKELSEGARELFEQFSAVMSVDEYLDLPGPRFT